MLSICLPRRWGFTFLFLYLCWCIWFAVAHLCLPSRMTCWLLMLVGKMHTFFLKKGYMLIYLYLTVEPGGSSTCGNWGCIYAAGRATPGLAVHNSSRTCSDSPSGANSIIRCSSILACTILAKRIHWSWKSECIVSVYATSSRGKSEGCSFLIVMYL